MEAGPLGLVDIAADTGCEGICLFVESPPAPGESADSPNRLFPTVTQATKAEMKARLAGQGIEIWNIEYFPIASGVSVETYRPALELGAELGGRLAVTHLHDQDEQRGIDSLGRLCDLTAELGLEVGLEFMGLSPACNSLERAVHYVNQVGRANLGVAVDALHLVRTGSTVEQVAALLPEMVAYAQICDGPHGRIEADYLPEAMDRMMPGEGVFPLADLVKALPHTARMDVEVPSPTMQQQGVTALDRARLAVAATRKLLAACGQ